MSFFSMLRAKLLSSRFLSEESGQSLVAVAVAFSALLGAAALALDLGAAYVTQQQLQNAADAAALAGARSLANAPSDSAAAIAAALNYAESNGASREETTVTLPYEGDPYKIEVVCRKKQRYGFAGVLGKSEGSVSARAVAECQNLRGPFDFAVFSGNRNYELPFNTGNMIVTGSIHSNDNLALRSSSLTVNGDVEAVDTLTINGGVTINGEIYASKATKDGRTLSTNAAPPLVDMPDFSELIRQAAQQAGTYYSKSTQFSSDGINVNKPIYVNGDISFNTPQVITGSGIIIATGSITFNAGTVLAPGASVCFYSKNKNIQINAGSITVEGLLYAPNGSIQANTGSFTVKGRVVGDKLQFNAGTIRITQGEHDRDCLPRLEVVLIE